MCLNERIMILLSKVSINKIVASAGVISEKRKNKFLRFISLLKQDNKILNAFKAVYKLESYSDSVHVETSLTVCLISKKGIRDVFIMKDMSTEEKKKVLGAGNKKECSRFSEPDSQSSRKADLDQITRMMDSLSFDMKKDAEEQQQERGTVEYRIYLKYKDGLARIRSDGDREISYSWAIMDTYSRKKYKNGFFDYKGIAMAPKIGRFKAAFGKDETVPEKLRDLFDQAKNEPCDEFRKYLKLFLPYFISNTDNKTN